MEQRIGFQDVPKRYMSSLLGVSAYLHTSELDVKLLHLIAYRVSQINGCAYCLDMHHKDAIYHGETEQRLHSLPAWRECPYYSDAERAVLDLADSIASQRDLDDAAFAELEKHFSKGEIADLVLAAASTATWNALNKAFRTIPGTYEVNQFKTTTVTA